jgi:hypothetical protein
MKRLVLILILLFPAITLLVWVHYGMTMRHPPPTPIELPANTNLTNLPAAE